MSSLDSIWKDRRLCAHIKIRTYPCPVSPTLCLRDLDPHFGIFQIPRGIPHEMPTSNPQDILATIRVQRRSARSNRLVFNLRHHQSQTHLHLQAHRQNAGQRPGPQGMFIFMSACLLVDPQTPLGDADLDGHVAGGSTRSGGTPARLLPITGDRHKGEAIDVVPWRVINVLID